MTNFKLTFLGSLLLAACMLTGCGKSGPADPETDYLICVGESVMTASDFERSFDIAMTAYPTDMLKDSEYLKDVRMQILKQMTERMILTERARELSISVSESELESAIARLKEGYPEGEFEKTLLESAISYNFWKKELRIRLLMEKVVAKEVGQRVAITSKDIAEYREEYDRKKDAENDGKETTEMAAQHLHRKKTEEAYQSWIKLLQERYMIKINKEEWTKIEDP
ncbi:SurA N-terminal domain-containing protein [Desulfococcaceae bacterium HSG8]|nr:SurA N-terminal domain-containing protein [Desulfococcaceae bacterium HSG8]